MNKSFLISIILMLSIFLGYEIFNNEFLNPVENKEFSTSVNELNKKIKSRDLMGQFQKFYETFKVYEAWTPEQKKIYQQQNNLSDEFLKLTEKYFNDINQINKKP